MRVICAFLLLFGLLFAANTATACDDHHGQCKLDGWRANHVKSMNTVTIDASATCDKGHARIRLYDGGEFLGVATGYIKGHVLETYSNVPDVAEIADLKIKYSIEPR